MTFREVHVISSCVVSQSLFDLLFCLNFFITEKVVHSTAGDLLFDSTKRIDIKRTNLKAHIYNSKDDSKEWKEGNIEGDCSLCTGNILVFLVS